MAKKKYKVTISYDGTNFYGYQIQPDVRTVQGEIEKVLATMHHGKRVRIHGSGRTDSGVHAKGQVFHFSTKLNIPEQNWKQALNAQLPDDIHVHEVKRVPKRFHARFSAAKKEYRYFVLQTEEPNVFLRNYRWMINDRLDVSLIEEACKVFIGKHDFTAFSSRRSRTKGSKVRTLYNVAVEENGDELVFILEGDGFLYHMVRIIASILVDAGRGLITPDQIEEMFETKDRGIFGRPAPPQGLYLWNVTYHERLEKFDWELDDDESDEEDDEDEYDDQADETQDKSEAYEETASDDAIEENENVEVEKD